IGCQGAFVADPAVQPPPPPPRRPAAPVPAQAQPRGGELPELEREEEVVGPDGRPYCPGCGRRVNWDWMVCYHCGEQFALSQFPRERGRRYRQRRDSSPHRGSTIHTMGNVTLAVGAVSLCILGLGVVVALPLGIATIVMATSDLEQMRVGVMDP